MKMNYHQKNSSVKKIFTHGLIFFVVLMLFRIFFSSFFSAVFYSIAKPFWNVRNLTFDRLEDTSYYVESKESLVLKNKELKAEIYTMEIKNLELTAQLSNYMDGDVLDTRKTENGFVSAKVVSKPPFSPFDILILNDGLNLGIKDGAKVYLGDNVLIGTVSSASANTSKVVLFSSGTEAYPAVILRTGEPATLLGQGSGNFKITLPKDFNIVVGDFLVDTNNRQSIIAKVYSIDSSSQGSFKDVYLHIPFNLLHIEWVKVDIR